MTNSRPKESVRVLLSEIVDYAGLFPPSQLPMNEAVSNFARYKTGDFSWMLGRFVVPSARREEFADAGRKFFSPDKKIWKLSVLAGEDIYETLREIEDFNNKYADYAVCDALEVKANSGARIEEIAEAAPPELAVYFEIPIGEQLADLAATIAISGRRAKIRTGGITADAFPNAAQIARFLRTCLAANVPFKATAGLHHPIRSRKPLTYEKDAPTGQMHGFLNFFLAAAFALQGFESKTVREILEDEQAENFQFDENGVLWRQEHFVSTARLKILREKNIISFGSCSFEEPIADLREIGIL